MPRAIDEKTIQSYPDGFEIIKVTALTSAGDVIPQNSIYISVVNGTPSALPTAGTTEHVAIAPITLKTGDKATIVGMVGRFPAIEVYNPAFANNSTDVVVNGEGKNLSVFNDLWENGKLTYGLFERIVIPTAETDMIILAYRA